MNLPGIITITPDQPLLLERAARILGDSFIEEGWTSTWLSCLDEMGATRTRKQEILHAQYLDELGNHVPYQGAYLLEDGTAIIKGAQGASGVSTYSTFLAGAILVMVTLVIVLNLVRSRTGRAIMAVRDNKIAAESIGLSVTRYKLLAFVISAVFAGMAGTLYAMNFSTVTASKFDFNTSILILVFVVLGGLGNIWGSIIAAALLTVLPELLRSMNDYRMLIYAILLIVMMIFNNSGAKKRLTEYFSAQKEKRTAKKAAGKGVN